MAALNGSLMLGTDKKLKQHF